jgi:hypothetical protein
MSFTKVAFQTHFKTDVADKQPPKPNVYNRKKPQKVAYSKWMSMSTLSCRDFTKNTYDYRDKHFILTDEGLTFKQPAHLSKIYERSSSFEKSEFRKLPLKPGKLRNENKKIFSEMYVSCGETFAHHSRIAK